MIVYTNIFGNYFDTRQPCCLITKEVYEQFVIYLQQQTNANDQTIYTYCTHIRAIFNYFMNNSYIVPFEIKMPKKTQKVKETYTDGELAILLKKPNLKTCNFADYRSWVLTNFLLGTGQRLSTVANIKIKDIDFDNSMLLLAKTKNRVQHIIPLSSTLASVLNEYLKYRQGEPEGYLFCNQYGQQMTKSGMESAIRRYNLARGVKRTSLHAYRHTFAKTWVLSGGDIFRLQKLLGHNSLDMVKQYVNMFTPDLQVNYNQFNALEQHVQHKNYISMCK